MGLRSTAELVDAEGLPLDDDTLYRPLSPLSTLVDGVPFTATDSTQLRGAHGAVRACPGAWARVGISDDERAVLRQRVWPDSGR